MSPLDAAARGGANALFDELSPQWLHPDERGAFIEATCRSKQREYRASIAAYLRARAGGRLAESDREDGLISDALHRLADELSPPAASED